MKRLEVKARHVFERWSAQVSGAKKNKNTAPEHFDNLFNAMSVGKVPFEIAHEYLERAAKAFYPSKTLIKIVYKKSPYKHQQTEAEFMESWTSKIKDWATESFYSFYTIEGDPEEEKKFGNMSQREYKKQRDHAEAFPAINLSNLDTKVEEGLKSLQEILEATGFEGKLDDKVK